MAFENGLHRIIFLFLSWTVLCYAVEMELNKVAVSRLSGVWPPHRKTHYVTCGLSFPDSNLYYVYSRLCRGLTAKVLVFINVIPINIHRIYGRWRDNY